MTLGLVTQEGSQGRGLCPGLGSRQPWLTYRQPSPFCGSRASRRLQVPLTVTLIEATWYWVSRAS